jgi:hypothetical protein
MKKIFLTALFLLIGTLSYAQLRLGLSPGYALPTGDFGAINKNGYGGSASAKYRLSERFALTSNFSFYAFGRAGEDLGDLAEIFGISPNTVNLLNLIGLDIQIPRTNFYPINLGFEYYILKGKVKPYVGFDIGFFITDTETISLDLRDLDGVINLPPGVSLGVIELNANDANFGLGPVVGCAYDFSNLFTLDLNIRANGIIVPDKKAAATVVTFNLGAFFHIPSGQ